MLSHLAARDTSWPEYCLEAIDELISAVRELSSTLPVAQDSADVLPGSQTLSRTVASQSAPSDGQESTTTANKRRGTISGWDTAAGVDTNPPSGGSYNESSILTQAPNGSAEANVQHQSTVPSSRATARLQPDTLWRQRPSRAQSLATMGVHYNPDASAIAANRPGLAGAPDPSSSFPVATDSLDVPLDTGPVEGQESMMWYDQLFASSFSAIDNPFLVAAEFDASIDPTWNYLR